jgi:preprotein translocase subunit SecA
MVSISSIVKEMQERNRIGLFDDEDDDSEDLSEDEDDIDRAIQVLKTDRETPIRPQVGRNAKCPCGSGKKYKYCCGKNATVAASTYADDLPF